MSEDGKYHDLISAIKGVVESMDLNAWNVLAEKVTTDSAFRVAGNPGSEAKTLPVDNLPVVLRHLLPELEIRSEEAVAMAIALGGDETIDHNALRPFGALLVGNLARMREVVPEKK